MQYKGIYKCFLASTYFNKDEAAVVITLTGKSSDAEIDEISEELRQDFKPINVEFDVSKRL